MASLKLQSWNCFNLYFGWGNIWKIEKLNKNPETQKGAVPGGCLDVLCDIFSGSSPTFARALLSIELFMDYLSVITEDGLPPAGLCVKLKMGALGKLHHILCLLQAVERATDKAVRPFRDTEHWTFAAFNLYKTLLVRSCESFPIVYMQLAKPATTATHRVLWKQQQQTTVLWFLNMHFARKAALDSRLCFLTTGPLCKNQSELSKEWLH